MRYKQKKSDNFEKKYIFHFLIYNIPNKKNVKIIFFPHFWPICILTHIFGKKNPNKCILIGLRKSYRVYKLGEKCVFFLFLYFLLVMVAICDF